MIKTKYLPGSKFCWISSAELRTHLHKHRFTIFRNCAPKILCCWAL